MSFVSRKMAIFQKNYPTQKLEFLALKWALVNTLKDYLYGAEFLVKTNNNPLTYILTSRWMTLDTDGWLLSLDSCSV